MTALTALLGVLLASLAAADCSRFVVNYLITGTGYFDATTAPLGSTHVILSFLEPATAVIPSVGDDSWIMYAAAEFWALPNRSQVVDSFHQQGTILMASLGGAAASHTIYSKYDATALGIRAAQYVIQLGLDGLDIDLEGWGNDPNAYNFLKGVTTGAFNHFKQNGGGKQYVLSHAPEMPYFWRGTAYAALMADIEAFSMIDFVNIQFYNQLQFPTIDHLYTKDMYDASIRSPTCLTSIVAAVAAASNGTVSEAAFNAKVLLGFPCLDGSLPIGSDNLNLCNQAQADVVAYGVNTAGYPLSGVFEWTAADVPVSTIQAWNRAMSIALDPIGE